MTRWTRRASKLGGQLGQVYGANTIGNIAGAVVSGFALLPALVPEPATSVEMRSAGALLLTSSLWAIAVAVGAVIVGWAPGRLLGRALPRRG